MSPVGYVHINPPVGPRYVFSTVLPERKQSPPFFQTVPTPFPPLPCARAPNSRPPLMEDVEGIVIVGAGIAGLATALGLHR